MDYLLGLNALSSPYLSHENILYYVEYKTDKFKWEVKNTVLQKQQIPLENG
jgi:hypothetical protein